MTNSWFGIGKEKIGGTKATLFDIFADQLYPIYNVVIERADI